MAASDDPAPERVLERAAASDPEPLVREHAQWTWQWIREKWNNGGTIREERASIGCT